MYWIQNHIGIRVSRIFLLRFPILSSLFFIIQETDSKCFLCLWDSRDKEKILDSVEMAAWLYLNAEKKVINQPVVDRESIVKVGIIKQHVTAMYIQGDCF